MGKVLNTNLPSLNFDENQDKFLKLGKLFMLVKELFFNYSLVFALKLLLLASLQT